ncbi:MAG: lysylphosphatidylglycerol synthase transmembrane domain-containing protein [Planctomycetota bacterium]
MSEVQVGGAVPAPEEPAASGKAAPRWRGWLFALVKLGLAAALLAWILRKPEFEWGRIGRALLSPSLLPILLLASLGLSCSGVRWLLLLRGEGIKVGLLTAIKLTWIGHFWNMVIPGAVSGDAVKMYYIGQVAPEQREEAWTTVFADRAVGLAALVAVAAIASLAQFEVMWAQPRMRVLLVVMVSSLVAFGVGMVVVGSGIGRGWAIVERAAGMLPQGLRELLRRAYGSLHRTCRRPGILLATFAISFFAHGTAVTNTFLLGRSLGEQDLSFARYSSVVPVALVANTIPLTPGGGVGVGESVIGQLFEWSGGSAGKGAMVMLSYRVVFFSLAAVGAALYAFYRHQDPRLKGLGTQAPSPAPEP